MIKTLIRDWWLIILLALPFATTIYFWDQLPDPMPIQYGVDGEVNKYGPKWVNTLLLPAIALSSYFLIQILPIIDPKKRIKTTQKSLYAFKVIIPISLTMVYAFVITKSLGEEYTLFNTTTIVGIIIIMVGNYLNSLKPNYFIGIRTPWTLESEDNWRKTHQFASKLWMVGGILILIHQAIPITLNQSFDLVVLAIIIATPFLYSFYLFRKTTVTS